MLKLCVYFTLNPSELHHVSIYLDILKLLSTYVCSMFAIPHKLSLLLLTMWVVRSFEKSVNIYQSARRNVQENWVVINASVRNSYPALHKITFSAAILVTTAYSIDSRNFVCGQTCGLAHMAFIPLSSCRYK